MTGLKSELELAERAYIFRGYLSSPGTLIDLAEKSTWTENSYTAYEDGSIRRYETSIAVDNEDILNEVRSALTKYAEIVRSSRHPSGYSIPAPWTFYISKYINGGHITSHTDEDYLFDNGIYTVIVYLNDEYDGGEVRFDDYNSEIKPSAGDILIFPSYYWHSGKAVVNGNKYLSIFRLKF